ncbi:MAG TPA: hypothetical protein VK662_00560 [Acidothermaceae bacterium]|nr:hypothetical protein [Acidothermaceae bacterium]
MMSVDVEVLGAVDPLALVEPLADPLAVDLAELAQPERSAVHRPSTSTLLRMAAPVGVHA